MTNQYIKNSFTKSQQESINTGALKRLRFIDHIERTTKVNEVNKYTHSYIYSPPGIGKTYTIQKQLDELGVNYLKITGNVSMYAFGIQLCVINYHNPNRERVVVFVDDCESLFATEESCNMMKNVLDGCKRFTYEKSLQSQWSNLSEIQKESVKYHQSDEKMGFEVPTETMVFIFASNFKLPVDDDIKAMKNKSTTRSILMSHKHAIRSRCTVGDFEMSDEDLWGWIADVTLNTECLHRYNLSDTMKMEMLNFLWDNWDNLKERSIRLVEKMAAIVNEYPDKYNLIWEIDFLK